MPDQSVTISLRRRLLEEVLEHRSEVVAHMPVEQAETPSGSPLWMLGFLRLATALGYRRHTPESRREVALDLAVVALAMLEAIAGELEELDAGRDG